MTEEKKSMMLELKLTAVVSAEDASLLAYLDDSGLSLPDASPADILQVINECDVELVDGITGMQ